MKILVLNLLRLGDFLMTVPTLAGLARRYPGARLDVLTHSPVKALHPMLPLVENWWTVDRDELQTGLGRADIPLLAPFDVLKEKMDALSGESYDLVVNLTQTRFSGYLMGYIKAKDKLGLTLNPQGNALFFSPWFRYMDQNAQIPNPDVFHYSDIFFQGCGLDDEIKEWPLLSTALGTEEVQALNLGADPLLLCQPMTSDGKKSWSEAGWISFLRELLRDEPELRFAVLGSPQEKAIVERIAQAADPQGERVRPAILSLQGALVLLRRAQALVTGDTSIKHLACAAPLLHVLELSLGSSDFARTGVYKEESLILQPRVPCAPCPHGSNCSQTSHLCADRLSPRLVARAVRLLRGREWGELCALAKSESSIAFFRTGQMESGFWFPAELAYPVAERTLDGLLERCTWKFLLNQNHKRPLAEFGSESVRLENEIHRLFPAGGALPLLARLDFLERELAREEPGGDAVPSQRTGLDGRPKVVRIEPLRLSQDRLNQRDLKKEIKMKLVRSLRARLMESL